ncbi:hypothetical protein [Cellulomonas sp. WB94]|uniref:hypothetical protein n=1 Tax=Cellulomonas sp. WB94 TaxID=2173174 RepID=UPI0011B1D00C|nr:hypothetical protein [Cellulomonas sp. WB94]
MTDDATRHPVANHELFPGTDGHWAADPDDDLADVPWLDGDTGTDDDSLPVTGRTLDDARDALDVLMRVVGPERDGPPALWFLVLDAADQVLPLVLPIAEVPTVPDAVVAANLVHVLASVLEHDAPGGSVVVGYVRRGGGDLGAFEAGWSSALHVGAHREAVRIRAEAAIGRDRARILSTSW